jgi:hypothetical protein
MLEKVFLIKSLNFDLGAVLGEPLEMLLFVKSQFIRSIGLL